MIHARLDYQHIQDETGRIAQDEPVILFRAQDQHFVRILIHYRRFVAASAKPDPNILEALDVHIQRASDWQHRNKTKFPDMNRMDVRPPELPPMILPDPPTG